MRILALSNLYPPYAIGGYEQGCKDVLEGLAGRGHQVQVLTTTYGVGRPRVEEQGEDNPITIERQLYFHWRPERAWQSAWELAGIEQLGLADFHRAVREFRPEVLSLWNMGGLSESLISAAQSSGIPAVFHISDEWPRRMGGDPWLHFWCRRPRRAFKRRMKSTLMRVLQRACGRRLYFQMPGRDFSLCHFTSNFLRRTLVSEGVKAGRSEVIHWGVRVGNGGGQIRLANNNDDSLRLLYLGQLVPHKGPHVVLEALGALKDKLRYSGISLTLAGTAPQPEYLARLHSLAEEKGLGRQVRFLPPQPRTRLTELCREHDVFVFPSVWPEPFSIALLEAMAAGLAVVATDTGGTPEVIRDRENGLLCGAEDADELAEKIETLLWNRALRRNLAEAARQTVLEKFALGRMIERVENLLIQAGGGENAAGN